MVNKLEHLLVCPSCKGLLDIQVSSQDELGVMEGTSRCLNCQKEYPIKEGIFYLQPEAETTGPPEGWDIAPFDREYQAMGYYKDPYEDETRKGIPKRVTQYYHERVKGRLLQWLDTLPQSVILDVGAGSGYHIFDMVRQCAGKGVYFIGLDVSKEHIKWLEFRKRQEGFNNILTVVGDARALPFRQEAFDVIVCTEVLEHIPAKQKVLNEIKTCLKKEGTLLLSTPSKRAMDFWNIVEAPYRLLQKVKSIPLAYDKPLYAGQLKQYLHDISLDLERFELNVLLAPKGIMALLPKFMIPILTRICGFSEKHMRGILAPLFAMHMVVKARKH